MTVKKRCEAILRQISLGKYHTTLYNKHGSAFHSSVLGGLITILAVSIIGVAILIQLLGVFNKSHYNLDIEAELIQAYVADNSYNLHQNATTCSSCVPIRIRDFTNIMRNTSIDLLNTSVNDKLNCTDITAEVVVEMFGGHTTIFNVSLEELS